MELQAQAFKPALASGEQSPPQPVFFSPETARVQFASNLPAPIQAKLAAHAQAKAALRAELREAIYDLDAADRRERAAALGRLAARQAAGIAALEVLAEEIRRDLAAPGRPLRATPHATSGAGEDATGIEATRALHADYEHAVFLPGLSPGQRRLLFDAAIEALALPLPDGERIP